MKTLKIWQLKDNDSNHKSGLFFQDYKCIKDRFSINNYKLIYDGVWNNNIISKNINEDLDKIFAWLNIGQKPIGYHGHSLSVSDLIELDGELFYVDGVGFIKL